MVESREGLVIEEEGDHSYGPMSEGVTGSEGGGGRLIRVGVVIVPIDSVSSVR
jgi:hypothetical protein